MNGLPGKQVTTLGVQLGLSFSHWGTCRPRDTLSGQGCNGLEEGRRGPNVAAPLILLI